MKKLEEYPPILTADDIAEYLRISKSRAYELMSLKSFPLLKGLGRSKRVNRESFRVWLENQEKAG